MDPAPISVLIIEEDRGDREFVHRALQGFSTVHDALSREDALAIVESIQPQCVLIDYRKNADQKLQLLRELVNLGATVIMMTGHGNQEIAVAAMKAGAADYLMKQACTPQSIQRAITNAIERAELREKVARQSEERENLLRKLQETLAELKTLSGLIPICAGCKNVRNDDGFWLQVEEYVASHTQADFSQSLCDECADTRYLDAGITPPEPLLPWEFKEESPG